MKIPEHLKIEILSHVKAAVPQEACGFVVCRYQDDKWIYVPCENVAVDPINYFEIDTDDFVGAEWRKLSPFALITSNRSLWAVFKSLINSMIFNFLRITGFVR